MKPRCQRFSERNFLGFTDVGLHSFYTLSMRQTKSLWSIVDLHPSLITGHLKENAKHGLMSFKHYKIHTLNVNVFINLRSFNWIGGDAILGIKYRRWYGQWHKKNTFF